ncbi:hypothetical protein [Galliscardovia ingluviei]|nr:hypothetical protein [Galliscardovia ingluviei]
MSSTKTSSIGAPAASSPMAAYRCGSVLVSRDLTFFGLISVL